MPAQRGIAGVGVDDAGQEPVEAQPEQQIVTHEQVPRHVPEPTDHPGSSGRIVAPAATARPGKSYGSERVIFDDIESLVSVPASTRRQ
ncbi:hypothetical protein PA7_33810 [Pseudonocardia asaccharolytica DSM 44247 = NBRC 16224]|uniref:Uncharacterized protein n=1 Tax=Pseudonocardia asaccharolytica DSM 44247 = NBRC 16224 TaxID=1123024 RepID=A0A511D7D8_9PSEU|nr:hypothetical protein PA7_33810 [Pseudonocardia asaccharolytica DSM 44247 = NBRC 16224]